MMNSLDRSRPLIGISPGYAPPDPSRSFAPAGRVIFCDLNYTESIEVAGGVPMMLAFTEDTEQLDRYADMIDGLVLIGGTDIHPNRYGQELQPTEQIPILERDEFEFAFLEKFIERKKPVFAICRGHQALNVFFGGTLIQDIPSRLGPVHHLQTPGSVSVAHQVRLDENCLIHRILEAPVIDVNSFHHQTIDQLGIGLRAVGWSEEGLVEVFEHESHPYLLSVQWHPERMRSFEQQRMLFLHFVEACANERLELVS
ncbi:MAG: gamma-glutamyl-gamma-aminobutyrate hydrolase family protein [bacterium]|nr:gamma-glutamyl-gamma-aminobutyrate hydrolase family protein [bacterium]